MSKWMHHVVLDVEADGPCPPLFNMISFGLVSVADPSRSFLGEVAPIVSSAGLKEAREIVGVSYETQCTYPAPTQVMQAAAQWLYTLCEGKRAIFWSDNPAFDWQYWNYYCHANLGRNPAGFSARRIGDLDAGRRGEPFNTTAWKKRKVTEHTHNPVDDARGNAEGLRWILEQLGERFA